MDNFTLPLQKQNIIPDLIKINSKWFWWWCFTLRIAEFLYVVHHIRFLKKHNVLEAESISILREKGREAPTQLSPLGRADLSHWR
jgi:hypothetical protein